MKSKKVVYPTSALARATICYNAEAETPLSPTKGASSWDQPSCHTGDIRRKRHEKDIFRELGGFRTSLVWLVGAPAPLPFNSSYELFSLSSSSPHNPARSSGSSSSDPCHDTVAGAVGTKAPPYRSLEVCSLTLTI